jgi:demethoxyubiquinone hydroxylase (CLK1/Coq7/Cat5 family)
MEATTKEATTEATTKEATANEQTGQKDTLRALNRLLRGELAAAATYEKALGHVASPLWRTALEQNRMSHADRVVMLSQQVSERGGEPVHTAGAWGTLAKMVEGGASLLSEKTVLRVLREGEAAGLETYIGDLKVVDAAAAETLRDHAIVEQQRTLLRLDDMLKEQPEA